MLNNEKAVKQLKAYDSNYQDDGKYVYACIEGGLKPRNNWLWYSILFVIVFISLYITDNTIITGALIGGIVGASASLANDYCFIIPGQKGITLYIFNKFATKIIEKHEVPNQDIELMQIKKRSIWHSLKIKLADKNLKIVISEKTLGLSHQTENAKNLIQKLEKENK